MSDYNYITGGATTDPFTNAAQPPYVAPPGKQWRWAFDSYGRNRDIWMLENIPVGMRAHVGIPAPAWNGLETDYQNFWRKPRPWWKRVLWLPWKKY